MATYQLIFIGPRGGRTIKTIEAPSASDAERMARELYPAEAAKYLDISRGNSGKSQPVISRDNKPLPNTTE